MRVQGNDAAAAVAAAVRTLSRRPVDVIVVVRGGGSRTDLAAFDDEAIALAIARAPVPVLTGLGHEVDRSVADHVAHTAYKTPTACAAALVDRVRQFDAAVAAAGRGVAARTTMAVRLADQRLDHTAGRLRREMAAGLDAGERRLGAAGERLARLRPGRPCASPSTVSTWPPPGCGCSIRPPPWRGAGASPAGPTARWCARRPGWPPATSWSPRWPTAR